MMPGVRARSSHLVGLLLVFAKGGCMGAADLVPGVSGGTMAVILGIYSRLLSSIGVLTSRDFWIQLMRFRISAAFGTFDGPFLTILLAGILSSILLLSGPIETALQEYPAFVWSFFFGLVLASAMLLGRRVSDWSFKLFLVSCSAAGSAFWLVSLAPANSPETWWFLVATGALASCAMILPGVSGSYVLVLLGKYQFILEALNNRESASLLLFAGGAAIGLLLFARGLTWLLSRFANLVLAVVAGLLLGSLRRVWPWQIELYSEKGTVLTQYYIPQFDLQHSPWEMVAPLAFFASGLCLVFLLNHFGRNIPPTENSLLA